MKYLDLLRAQRAEIEEWRKAVVDQIEAVATKAIEEKRTLTPDDESEIERLRTHLAGIDAEDGELDALNKRIAELEAVEARTAEIAKRPELHIQRTPEVADVIEDRNATPTQLADALTRAVEDKVDSPENLDHARKLFKRHAGDRRWARELIIRSTDAYASGWLKAVTGRLHELDNEERTALSTVTNANGNFLVPTHLDPTVILTNDGSSNIMRQFARIVTLTAPGDTSWQGITSAGITASFDAQLTEVSDDSPTFGQPTVPVHKAQAFAQASIEAESDIANLAGELLTMFADARDVLEGEMFMTGSGSDQPTGIFTALDANTNVEVTSTTAATIGEVDIHGLYAAVPQRWRGRSTWLMAPTYALAIKRLGTAVSSSFSGDLTAPVTDRILGRPVVESDDAPTTQTTTVRDNEIIFGDLSNYLIVDKPGSLMVRYIPVMFNTTTNLPDGRVGWYVTWRAGGDSINDLAMRLLQDKTSA